MKAVILAAGNGERLRPLTDMVPKCLLPVCGRPMLQSWLELCRQNRVSEILINTHAHADVVTRYLRDHPCGIPLTVAYEERLLGSAGTLRANREWIGSDGDFWIFYSDVLTNANPARMQAFHTERRPIATLGVFEAAKPRECGIVCVDNAHLVQAFVEKPIQPRGNLAFSGIMIASPAMLDEIPDQTPADLGFHVIPKLLGRAAAYRISEYLADIGTPLAYQRAQLSWRGLSTAA
jgi:mannose-1-phosphate guanylyltransferase